LIETLKVELEFPIFGGQFSLGATLRFGDSGLLHQTSFYRLYFSMIAMAQNEIAPQRTPIRCDAILIKYLVAGNLQPAISMWSIIDADKPAAWKQTVPRPPAMRVAQRIFVSILAAKENDYPRRSRRHMVQRFEYPPA